MYRKNTVVVLVTYEDGTSQIVDSAAYIETDDKETMLKSVQDVAGFLTNIADDLVRETKEFFNDSE
jgi:hypothetical protein